MADDWVWMVALAVVLLAGPLWETRRYLTAGCRHGEVADWCPWCWRVKREHA
jgi:hypothetical protein